MDEISTLARFIFNEASKQDVFNAGDVVVPTGVAVLEADGSLDHYTGTLGFKTTLVTESALLLVVECKGDEVRVMELESGQLGRLNAGGLAKYE